MDSLLRKRGEEDMTKEGKSRAVATKNTLVVDLPTIASPSTARRARSKTPLGGKGQRPEKD